MNLTRVSLVCMGFAAGLVSCVDPTDTPTAAETSSAPASSRETGQPSAAPVSTPIGKVTRIALGDLFPLQQSGAVLLYDVRPAFYHTLGHIPGSVNWPKSAFPSQLPARETEMRAAVAAGKPVVLYCTDLACPDARSMASLLAARGHSVRVLEGGWEAWKAGQLPTE